MKKKILFIYSGGDEFQNSAMASLKQYVNDYLSKYYDFEILNTDKHNLEKKLENNIYDIIYCADYFYRVLKYVLNNYTDSYSKINKYSVEQLSNKWGSNYNYKALGEQLYEELQNSLPNITKYTYNQYENKIEQLNYTELLYDNMGALFDTYEECLGDITCRIQNIIDNYKSQIERLEDSMKREIERHNELINRRNYPF